MGKAIQVTNKSVYDHRRYFKQQYYIDIFSILSAISKKTLMAST